MTDNHKQKREGVVSPMSPQLGLHLGLWTLRECATGLGSHPDPRKRAKESEFYQQYSVSSSDRNHPLQSNA